MNIALNNSATDPKYVPILYFRISISRKWDNSHCTTFEDKPKQIAY